MKQLSFLPKVKTEHGGNLSTGKRKSRRPLDPKNSHHLVLRSELAVGARSLFTNRILAQRIIKKYAQKFQIRIYDCSINGNHIHLLAKGSNRRNLQNFFRVAAGQVAQELLKLYPLQKDQASPARDSTHWKNGRTFWSTLIYSKIISWGREFQNVKGYIIRNIKETLGLIPYQERKKARGHPSIVTGLP